MAGIESSEEGSADQQSEERCGSYSLSADVSESESSGSFPSHHYDGSSSSLASPPPPPLPLATGNSAFLDPLMPPANLMFRAVNGKDVLVWDQKPERRDTDLSGACTLRLLFVGVLSCDVN